MTIKKKKEKEQQVKRRQGRKNWKSTIELTLMALPAVVLLAVFNYAPMPGMVLAFKNYNFKDGIWGSPWNGFDNFKVIFSTSIATDSIRNTILYNVAFIIVGLVAGIGLALLMNNIISKRALKIYQTCIFIPYYLSWSIVAYIVFAFLSNGYGYINGILESLGLERIPFYDDPKYWPFILVFMNFWKGFGYTTILYYARILGIDPTYYEAAALDGANRWQQAIHITIPCLSPIILVNLINSIGRIFNTDFSMFWMLPMQHSLLKGITSTLDTYTYSALSGSTGIAMAAAAGVFKSVISLILILLANRFIRKTFGADRAMF